MKISLSSWTNIDFEFLNLAKAANISIISYGIESADEEILKFYKKSIDLAKIKELIEYANKIGLFSVGNFMFGAPMESEKSIKKTFDYILSIPFDNVNLKILSYMAGADIYNALTRTYKNNDVRFILACQENGLTNYKLSELTKMISTFYIEFQQTNHFNFNKKIKNSPPYQLSN